MGRRKHLVVDPDWFGRITEALFYDPDTGAFRWLITIPDYVEVGDYAGSLNNEGYVRIKFERVEYLAHRLAFVFQTGAWPRRTVDHIDRNRTNNCWSNLRDVTQRVNNKNRGLPCRKQDV